MVPNYANNQGYSKIMDIKPSLIWVSSYDSFNPIYWSNLSQIKGKT